MPKILTRSAQLQFPYRRGNAIRTYLSFNFHLLLPNQLHINKYQPQVLLGMLEYMKGRILASVGLQQYSCVYSWIGL